MTSASPMPLSFSREIFATVSPAPYLLANLTNVEGEEYPRRTNSRQTDEFRLPIINVNSLQHCFGSAVVRTGDTAVVCGVRGEILHSSDIANPPNVPATSLHPQSGTAGSDTASPAQDIYEIPALNLLVPNIELATGSSPAYLPGNPPTALAQTLSQRMLSLLHSTRLVDVNDLRILYQPPATPEDEETPDVSPAVEIKAYWTLYIDILFMSLDGNPFDAAWGALLAALKNTKLPRAWWDPDLEMIVCSDAISDARGLNLHGVPVSVSFAVFDTKRHKGMGEKDMAWVLADPDTFEEGLCEETVTIVVDGLSSNGMQLRRIEKSGGTIVGKDIMRSIVGRAAKRWEEWHSVIGQAGG
ncbi:exoribonuclease family protein [Rhizodiscina lignyota]|uniref:Ribosomal RNA-processing protein 43 n=1 Tax=Rhizodiscina lignyota TaxID=1504668 RepID=A0A9P4IC71_9PEZI|nr:exoribonuclease family protein [Rhizodiscina lignyota]